MLTWLRGLFRAAVEPASARDEYDPVYGLPKREVEQWLARNPQLREEYEIELCERSVTSRVGDGRPARGTNPTLAPECGSLTRRYQAEVGRLVTAGALEQQARKKLKAEVYDYLTGGAGPEDTTRANRRAFQRWRIVPRVLRGVAGRDLGVELFGRRFPSPMLLAPIGAQALFHPEGELAVARAARSVGVPLILSAMSSRTLEEVAEAAGDGPRWFQLYWPANPELAASFLQRADRAGYGAVVVTPDAGLLSWRGRDSRSAPFPFVHLEGLANYYSDPVFRAAVHGDPENHPVRAARYLAELYSRPALTWGDLPFLRRLTRLPILLKGVLAPEDAQRAVSGGIDGVIVSNHGGRQLDSAVAALDALPAISDAVAGRAAVLFDSGIRCASDVVKALSLGAEGVLLGRPYCFGLAVNGEQGVRDVLQTLLADLELMLGLAGCASVKELGRANLVETPPGAP